MIHSTSDETREYEVEYEAPDATREYDNDEEYKDMIATFNTYAADYEEAKQTYHIDSIYNEFYCSTPTEIAYEQMYHDLYDELRDLPAITHLSLIHI